MFRTRLLSGIALVAIALGVFLSGGALMAVVVFGVSVIAYQELTRACKVRGEEMNPSAPVIVGLVMTLVYYGMLCLALARDISVALPAMVVAIVAAFLAFLFVYVFAFPKYHANQIMSAMFSFLYGPVMLSFLFLLREGFEDGIYLVWFVFLASWGSDTCAYCVGVLIGKHKMTPKLSPKSVTLEPAARDTTSKSFSFLTMSSVCVPIEPVEPSIPILFIAIFPPAAQSRGTRSAPLQSHCQTDP